MIAAKKFITFITAALPLLSTLTAKAGNETLRNDSWSISCNENGITGIVAADDAYQANLLRSELGWWDIRYRVKDGFWQKIAARPGRGETSKREVLSSDSSHISYIDRGVNNSVQFIQTFSLQGKDVKWDCEFVNKSRFPLEIGDLGFNIPYKTGGEEPIDIFERSFTKHINMALDGSFMYFTRCGGSAPYYVVIPDDGTPIEYYGYGENNDYFTYVHSGYSGPREKRGNWRHPHTSVSIGPGESLKLGFTIAEAGSYQEISKRVGESGKPSVKVAPGLTVTRGEEALVAISGSIKIDSLTAEHPGKTAVRYLRTNTDGTQIWAVEMQRLGENMVTIHYNGGRHMPIEMFCALSPETLLKKRSSFLVDHQQFRGTGRWYDGLYGVYDMKEGQLRGPDNPDIFDSQRTYFLASDDPILGKAPFLAAKNAVFPDKKEIESLEYHIEHFVWGGLQRTGDETPYPYGVYGTPDWNINRNTDLRLTQTDYNIDRIRVWRTYDYAHMIMLWWEMFKIADRYPSLSTYATADEYLRRAYETAKVYWTYPTELQGFYYKVYQWGCYNECVIPEIVEELERRGMKAEAGELRDEWQRKVDYFVHEERYPFRSEYAVDRTAFESTYILGEYAMVHEKGSAEARDFMDRQLAANLSSRGVLEQQWYILGSDFVTSSDYSLHTYMARMGAWGVIEYALKYADDPYDLLRVGYAGHTGPMGLINAGDAESNYGYWYPGKEKDGSMGQSFTPVKYGHAWIGTDEERGPWRYCGEGDLGLCAVNRVAATVLVQDPVFGWIVYGGRVETSAGGEMKVYPDDGQRTRFWIVTDRLRQGYEVKNGNWSSSEPITVSRDLRKVTLPTESPEAAAKKVSLSSTTVKGRAPKVSMR